MIVYIKKSSNVDKVSLIAHSSSTTSVFYGIVKWPEFYNKYIIMELKK